MIKKYIKSENTLILIIRKATQDVETVAALNMAKKFDPERTRILEVITQCDLFSSDEQKQFIK